MASVEIGHRFGKWTVSREHSQALDGKTAYVCRCECGTERVMRVYLIKTARSPMCKGCARATHGATRKKTRWPEYGIWQSMLNRCRNPNTTYFGDYGGRGISVCDAWNSFENFISDMGRRPSKKHSIDRIDNDGNYEPSNCRWATISQQATNKRNTILISHLGQSLSIREWAERSGLNEATIRSRLNNGWDAGEAVTKTLIPNDKSRKEYRRWLRSQNLLVK